MSSSLSYLLAVALRELFPAAEIGQIEATDSCFFCDCLFPDSFTPVMMSLLEERMRNWVSKKISFQSFEMMPTNAAQFLNHHGEPKLAEQVRHEDHLVTLLQIDRFFFQMKGQAPLTTADHLLFKLVCFWPLRRGIRILGTSGASKDQLKERAQVLKRAPNLQKKLEELKLVSWVESQLIWESKGEALKDLLSKKILQLYREWDRVYIPVDGDLKKILIDWLRHRKRSGFQLQKKRLSSSSSEPWDTPIATADLSWGRVQDINSFLHIITKFLTILPFDYEVICVAKPGEHLEQALRAHQIRWKLRSGRSSQLEFRVIDQLGRQWPMSSLEWDQKNELVQMTLCASFERCIALWIEARDIETILNRLETLEN